jgi:hypothetical protein
VTLELTHGGRSAGLWNVPENTVRWYRNLERSVELERRSQ